MDLSDVMHTDCWRCREWGGGGGGGQGLRRNASSVSFGHAEHCFFDSLDTQNFMTEFAEDDFS